MVSPRTRKVFRIALRIQSRLYTKPEIALRGARRLERIINGHSPFVNEPSNTVFQTQTGEVRVL